MPFFETALGGAALDLGLGLVKGIFGGRSAKKQRAQALQDQQLQFVRLRDAAEAGGFNPLTVLGANPGAGMVNPTPALASGEFVADALGGSVETYFNRKTQLRDEERDKLEKALMRQELQNMQAQGKAVTQASMGFGYAIPTANNTSGATLPPLVDLTKTARTPGYMLDGKWVFTDPNFVDAEMWEQRYGELGAEAYGARVAAADLAYQEKARRWGGPPITVTKLRDMPGVTNTDSRWQGAFFR